MIDLENEAVAQNPVVEEAAIPENETIAAQVATEQSPTDTAEPEAPTSPKLGSDLTATQFAQKSLNAAWSVFYKEFAAKFGNGENDENLLWLRSKTAQLQFAMLHMSAAGSEFMDYYNEYFIRRRGEVVETPVIFHMQNLATSFSRASHALPPAVLNKHGVGSDDPNWTYNLLPTDRIVQTDERGRYIRVPIKAETFNEIIFGFYELFIHEKEVEGKKIYLTTEFPAIRVKENYIPPSAIWRWYEVTEKDVRDAWHTGRSIVKK